MLQLSGSIQNNTQRCSYCTIKNWHLINTRWRTVKQIHLHCPVLHQGNQLEIPVETEPDHENHHHKFRHLLQKMGYKGWAKSNLLGSTKNFFSQGLPATSFNAPINLPSLVRRSITFPPPHMVSYLLALLIKQEDEGLRGPMVGLISKEITFLVTQPEEFPYQQGKQKNILQ